MIRHLATLVLAFSLSGVPASAQTLVASASRHGALASQQAEQTEIPAGLKWSGIGLLAGGAGTVVLGFVTDNGCEDFTFAPGIEYYDQNCHDTAKGLKILGGIIAGTGGALLAIGIAKRRPVSPFVTFQRGRLLVQQQIRF